MYDSVMTAKSKKTKRRKSRPSPRQSLPRPRPGKIGDLRASVEDELLMLADEATGAQPRWNRPRKLRISLRIDTEVVDWFKSKGAGYQTRINRVLRRVMMEGKKRAG